MNKTTDTYISLNREELLRLNNVSYEAFGLYMRLKEKANFRTGVVGRFFNQKLTYATFAKLMGRPASQGRAAMVFDSTAIKRLLAQLEETGLVVDHAFKDQKLTLCLPLSPLWKDNPELAANSGKLPRENPVEPLKSKVSQGIRQVSENGSVVTSKRGSIPFFSSVSSDCGGDDAADFPKERGARPAAKAPGKSATLLGDMVAKFEDMISAQAGAISPSRPECREAYARWATAGVVESDLATAICRMTFAEEPTFDPLELEVLFANLRSVPPKQLTRPLAGKDIVADYRACLSAAGAILTTTDASQEVYKAWEKAKVTVEAVQQAIDTRALQNHSPLRPGDLNPWLFPSAQAIREEQKKQSRSRVAL